MTGLTPALMALEARALSDLALVEKPLRQWVPPRKLPSGELVRDVVIIGAGLSGLAIGFGLKQQGVGNVLVIDAAAQGEEGPWITTARMRTLRSPKTLTGPDLGLPSLTYRAWHEAVYGPQSWNSLEMIARQDWMAYLIWFRRVIGLDIRNDTRLLAIEEGPNGLINLRLDHNGAAETLACRKVVLATGMEGSGGLHIPDAIVGALPRERWTHSGEAFDATTLAGKDVGVIGAAASGFDWAVTALEAGARSVTVLARSQALPQTEVLDWSNFPGFLNHFSDLDDMQRYRFARRLLSFKTPPTIAMYELAMGFPNCRLALGTRTGAAQLDGDAITLTADSGERYRFDHLLLGTGYSIDLPRRPELAGLVDEIALWKDRFTALPGEEDPALLAYPFLGPAFEFTEKVPGAAPILGNIHVFNHGAVPSLGPVCNGITGLKSGVPKIVAGISRGLFLADAQAHYHALDRYDKVHFAPASAAAS